jgi:hypothetical protein
MRKLIILFKTAMLLILLYGCSAVRIYSDKDLTNKTGLKFYTVKPYILEELRGEKDLTIKTTVIYLPDMANPQYLKVIPGIGSNELKITFTNGMMQSYGLTTDQDINGTISSLATLTGKIPDLLKQAGVISNSAQQISGDSNFNLYEIVITAQGTQLKRVENSGQLN